MSDKEILAGVLIKPEAGRVKIELVNLDSDGQSLEMNMPVADACKFSAALIKAIASAEALEKGQDEEVKNSVKDALKKLAMKLKEKQND